MLRIKRWFREVMHWYGWVTLADFNELLADKIAVDSRYRGLKARTSKLEMRLSLLEGEGAREYIVELERRLALAGNIETREARIKQLEVGIKPIPSKTEDIRQHLLDTDNEKASEIKYRALKKRTRELVDTSVHVAKYLRRVANMKGRGNEDVARLHSAAQMLHDPQYVGSLPDVAKHGAVLEDWPARHKYEDQK